MKGKIILIGILIFCIVTCIGIFHLGKIKDRDISRFCTITKENEEYRVKITDSKGEVIYDERYGTEPTVITSDRDTLLIRSGKGDWHSYVFVNTRVGKVSESFDDISAWNSEFVVYATYKEDSIRIVIQNIYDKNEYYMEICRDYAQVAVPHHVVQQAEFLDEKQVRIEYYERDNEMREEIIPIFELAVPREAGITNIVDSKLYEWQGKDYIELAYATDKGNGDIALYEVEDRSLELLLLVQGGVDRNLDLTTNSVYEGGKLNLSLREMDESVQRPDIIVDGFALIYGYENPDDFIGDEVLYQRMYVKRTYSWDGVEYLEKQYEEKIIEQVEGVYKE